jgi:predicted dehydrogenase
VDDQALRAGKHVLCEKPFAMTRTEAEEMFDEARKAQRVLVEAFMYRSHPLTHAMIDAVRGGEIGEPQARSAPASATRPAASTATSASTARSAAAG